MLRQVIGRPASHARVIAAFVVLLSTGAAVAAGSAKPPASVSVTLPPGADEFPGGKRAEAINNTCLTCHSKDMVLMQPVLSKKTWTEEVLKMRKVFGAPVDDNDIPAIVDYLDALRPSP